MSKIHSIKTVKLTKPTTLYDIGVDGNNNYFVYDNTLSTGVLVHNCHGTSSNTGLKIINSLNTRYLLGLTATPDRKDGRYFLTDLTLGPVIHETAAESLKPSVEVVKTEFKTEHANWTYGQRAIEKDEDLNELIIKHVIADVQAGHSIIIPVYFVSHCLDLTKAINKAAVAADMDKIAVSFDGSMKKMDRQKAIKDMRTGKKKVLVGLKQIVSTGVNIGCASAIYEFVPSSNLPKAEQRLSRVLTPMPGTDKLHPIVKYFLLNTSSAKACLRNELNNVLIKVLGARMSDFTKQTLKQYLSKNGFDDKPTKEL